nr:MAG TPA: hypothetical protein [Caudoviricetes sp.]
MPRFNLGRFPKWESDGVTNNTPIGVWGNDS